MDTVSPAAVIESDYFVTGGTLPATSASYVERSADRDLLEHIRAGRFCYVLNSRQMGKSSLCVRTMQRLAGEGIRCAFVDLTKIGGRNVTPEQWYAGVSSEIARSLGMRSDVLSNWKENQRLSPVQRLFGSLRQVVLEQIPGKIAIFFDEIDATRSLPFSADEFFAAIRECYNRRAQDPVYERLTFCLLGVAVPSDLIHSPTSTPFNVGDRIYLRDFTLEEAMKLAEGLPKHAEAVLRRVFYWTNGHPYLTQSLCAAAASQRITTPDEVDALVRRDLFDPKARETNINLADVGNRALHAGDLESDPEKFRADLLSAYQKAWQGKALADDEANRVAALLKMSGMMRSEGNRLTVRNRIYRHVFDKAWIRENMPGQELRRQRRAFWLGVLRTTTIAAVILAVIGGLAWKNARLAELAESRRKLAEYRLYVSDVGLMQSAYERGDLAKLDSLLNQTKESAYRNFEWRYWYAKLNDTPNKVDQPYGSATVVAAPDGSSFAVADGGSLRVGIYSLPGLRALVSPTPFATSDQPVMNAGRWANLDYESQAVGEMSVSDMRTGAALGTYKSSWGAINEWSYSPDTNFLAAVCMDLHGPRQDIVVWDARTFRQIDDVPISVGKGWNSVAISNGGRFVGWCGGIDTPKQTTAVYDRVHRRTVDQFQWPAANGYPNIAITGDGRYVAVGYASGDVVVRDAATHRTVFSRSFPGVRGISVFISSDGRRITTAGSNLLAQVWDVSSGSLLIERKGAMTDAMTLDGRRLIVSGDGTRVYDIPARYSSADTDPLPFALLGEAPDGLIGSTALGVGLLGFGRDAKWNRPTGNVGKGGSGVFWSGAANWGAPLTPSRFVVRQTSRGPLSVFNADGWSHVCELAQGSSSIFDISDSADRIATIAMTQHLYVYDLSGRQLWDRVLPGTWYTCRISPDGDVVAAGGIDGTILLFDGATGRELKRFRRNTGTIYSLAFSKDGSRLAAGDIFRTILIYALHANSSPIAAVSHTAPVISLQFSPDDSRLLSGSDDGTVRLWDPDTGQEMLRIDVPFAHPITLQFLPAGDAFCVGDRARRTLRFAGPTLPAKLDLLSKP